MIASWPCPVPGGTAVTEYAVAFIRGRRRRLLIVPALFDEANRLRRLAVQTMRLLDAAGIDSVLPDLPGCNESLQPLAEMTLDRWSAAMEAAAEHFAASDVLALRGGALVAPALPGWTLAPATGEAILRTMIRARLIVSREAGRKEPAADLLALALRDGIELGGHPLSAELVRGLHGAQPRPSLTEIAQSDLGGAPLWLRSEPGDDPVQAQALAARTAAGLQG